MLSVYFVRMKGLEPPRLSASDPKSDASANFATPAFEISSCKNTNFLKTNLFLFFLFFIFFRNSGFVVLDMFFCKKSFGKTL